LLLSEHLVLCQMRGAYGAGGTGWGPETNGALQLLIAVADALELLIALADGKRAKASGSGKAVGGANTANRLAHPRILG
jgi:hypothetical protein